MAKKMQRRRRQKRTRSQRGELPLSLVDRFLREEIHSSRLSYLTSNILELAGEVAQTTGRKRIAPEDVRLVVQNNEQLRQLFKPGGTSVNEDDN